MLKQLRERFRQTVPRSGRPRTTTAPAANGYYDDIPLRVNDFVLETNEAGRIVFETTDRERCDDGPKMVIRLTEDDGNWSATVQHGPYQWAITSSIDALDTDVGRKRVCWHAAQEMVERDLSHAERFTLSRRVQLDMSDVTREDVLAEVDSDDPDLDSLGPDDSTWTLTDVYADDAFFEADGTPVADPPFKEFLADR